MLSISDFSEMSHLPPQTLRYYHAEGLLVPAGVDERTGYRSYAFEQVEQAMVITVLREAGLSVKLVRQALDEPDRAPGLLRQHAVQVERERRLQAEAITAAWGLFDAEPQVKLVEVPAMTVASRPVQGTLSRTAQEWDEAEEMLATGTAELVAAVEAGGGTVTATPWRTLALGKAGQDERVLDGTGPFWLAKVPFEGPYDGEAERIDAHQEVSVFLPGRSSMAQYCTAIVHLYAYPFPEGTFANTARMRITLRPGGVETSAPVEPLRPEPDDDEDE